MNILALDTSAKAASCAICGDGVLLAEFFINVGLTHSQTIMPMVQNALDLAGMPIADIDVFAVSSGPGSFTGLRIGISAVKGMALALQKPCVPVSTLEALAYNVSLFDGIIAPVMDARRNQVYTALFKSNGGTVRRITDDEAISIDELFVKLSGFSDNVMLVGDGANLCYSQISEKLPAIRIAPENLLHQRAASVCAVAKAAAESGLFADAETLAPVYLRLPQAERERMEKSR